MTPSFDTYKLSSVRLILAISAKSLNIDLTLYTSGSWCSIKTHRVRNVVAINVTSGHGNIKGDKRTIKPDKTERQQIMFIAVLIC